MAAVLGFILLISLITLVKMGTRRLFRGKQQPAVEARRPPGAGGSSRRR
jgi:hypothetical protein